MKRILGSALLLSAALSFAGLPNRSVAPPISKLNTANHFRQPAVTPDYAPADAPANTQDVPFNHRLGKNDDETKLYSLTDANLDTKTWKIGAYTGYSVCMKPTDTSIDRNDDWLWSPPVYLEAGKPYRVSLDTGRALTSGKEEELEIMFGTSATVEAMTMTAMPRFTYTHKALTAVDADFNVSETGYYYFGIHCVSQRTLSGNAAIANFGIRIATPKVDPAAPGTLTYTVGERGSLTATCTYTAPALDVNGASITEPMTIKVITNGRESNNIENVAPGATVNFETKLANHGNNYIEATAYRGDTPGSPVRVSGIWAGPDSPLPPANVRATLSDDYTKVTLTWDAVGEVGEHGGWVNTEGLTYYVFDAFGSIYDPAVAETERTSVTIDYADIQGQDFVAYQVTAGTVDYQYSLDASSNIVSVGTPYTLPFSESFANGSQQQQWCIEPASSSAFQTLILNDNELQVNLDDEDAEPVYLNSQDGDNGFIVLLPTEPNATLGIFSNKLNISGYDRPVFDFYYQGQGSILEALVGVNGGDMNAVRTINLREQPTGEIGNWQHCLIELGEIAAATDTRYIQVGLRVAGVHNTDSETWSVPIDNINVRNYVAYDLAVSSFDVSSIVAAGDTADVTARIYNQGYEKATGAKATVACNGELIATVDIPEIAPAASAVVRIPVPTSIFDPEELTVNLTVEWASDVDRSNNDAVATIAIRHSELPEPTGLSALSENGTVTLIWDRPQFDHLTTAELRVEDFENPEYTPFTIESFGGWQFVDVDGGKTYTFLDDTKNPYRTMPMAYQLYTPELAGIPDRYMADIPPHSGKSLLVAFSCAGLNDNWLISPALSGDAQTVSFWGRGFSVAFSEDFEVYYSTTGTAITDFIRVAEVKGYAANAAVPETWTNYSFDVPAGTRYFAIRHVAYDTYALYLDDFTFTAAGKMPSDLAVKGYRVYRDCAPIHDSVIENETHVDTPEANGTYRYHVQAVYNYGESRPGQPVTVDHTSGIENVSTDDVLPVSYYDLQGIPVDRPLRGSIVIRRQGNTVTKVLVK